MTAPDIPADPTPEQVQALVAACPQAEHFAESVRLPRRGEQVRCNVGEPHGSHLQALACRDGRVGERYPIVCPGVPWNDALDVVIGMAEAAVDRAADDA